MASNVIRLPVGPRQEPPETAPLGFFVRVGYNDHREVLDLIASGEQGICGLVIDAQNVTRHRELIGEAGHRGLHLILDPKTQPMALPGGHTETLAALPWGLPRCHRPSDFDDNAGRDRAASIVKMAVDCGCTQVLGPTHLLTGVNYPWLRRDIKMMCWAAEEIDAAGSELDLIYALAVPLEILRSRIERQALVSAIGDAPCQAIWLKTENFGDDASGDKTTTYIEACRDFHDRRLPIIGDHVGGLPGLAALAFGAVGGIAHGVNHATELPCCKLASATDSEQWWASPPSLFSGIRRIVEAEGCAVLARKLPTRASTMRMSRHALLPAGRARHDCSAGAPRSLSARSGDRDTERHASIGTGSTLP